MKLGDEKNDTPCDFGLVPVPKNCRFDKNFQLSIGLNILLAVTSTFSVANIYYPQPILVQLAERYDVSYERVTRTTSLLQAGYLCGLIFLTPLGDLVRRRQLLLVLLLCTAALSVGQALAPNFEGFEAVSFIQGVFTVTPQVLNPLTADLAPPHRRATAVSITVSGLVAGMVVARVLSGVITRYTGYPNNVYWFASATQFTLLFILYFFLPNFPKKRTGLRYHEILWSMVKLFFKEPVLVQSCFNGMMSTAIFVSHWTVLTFLLNDAPFSYDTFETGLFGLTGIVAVVWAPLAGRLTDRLNPWLVQFIAMSGQLCTGAIAVGAIKYNLAPVIIVCIFVDVWQQTNNLGQQQRIYAIDPLSRARVNGVLMAFVFAGQAMASAAGPKMYLQYGWRAAYGLNLAWNGLGILFLLARGPRAKGWLGWSGNYSLRKETEEEAKAAEKAKDEEATVVVEKEDEAVKTITVQ